MVWQASDRNQIAVYGTLMNTDKVGATGISYSDGAVFYVNDIEGVVFTPNGKTKRRCLLQVNGADKYTVLVNICSARKG